MSWPSSIDTFPGTAAQGTSLLTSPDHANDHRLLGSFAGTAENIIGLGGGTPKVNTFFQGIGGGSSQWGTAGTQLTFGSSTFNNGTLGTNLYQGGTINNATLGTPTLQAPTFNGAGTNSGTISGGMYGTTTIQGGTANNQTLGTPTIQGAVVNTANIVANAVTNALGTNATGLSQTITTTDPTTTPFTGGTVTLITTGGPCFVTTSVNAKKDNASGYVISYITLDGTQVMYGYYSPGQSNAYGNIALSYYSVPAAGTHNWVFGGAVQSGTMTINAFAINVMELKR